ncbi:M6 family metalloprotease domain-containing protein [Paractinoplanes atraurantiacus]|uniref:M6 family metalloprotease domain-containing protein n=1 Tax=Paractinoplanes atraurantiacus TaxID=1036182 RepID=A0A285KNA9_9ACTN|nr:M6 family metalloprotease domain-containing protein [Actinoplanes atraurantiacus]SNY74124.1 M6 family metalloprotease domain-containing protein [Actinoplanes atraurantiacus]
MTSARRLVSATSVVVLALAGALTATPASAAPPGDPDTPWRMRHWPQTQPWQVDEAAALSGKGSGPQPVDPQRYELPDTMTWSDYKPIPGTDWADPAVKGSERNFNGALVLVDYPNQPFVVTQPANSTIYGNPSGVQNLARSEVPQFYRDFLNKPGKLNRGHTIHEYWMEDSNGRFGIELSSFGVYQMPSDSHEYGIEAQMQRGQGCPAGDVCNRNLRTDARAAWVAAVGEAEAAKYDFVFFLSAGQDESATWQEFGPMKFTTKEDVTDEWGPPDAALPNWNATRYVDWTSWQASANIWPNATQGSSLQAESSGMSTYAHEFSHILGVGDNYNNPYSVPARRDYSGPWEMLSRGTFNGPGGPHSRWLIPGTSGSSMGAQHMLRNKMKLGIVDDVLQLSRAALAESGVVVTRVTARTVDQGRPGINVVLDGGDLSPACDTATDPFCDGGGYDNYTLEVVDRMGFDSFTPDSGVLLAKTKNADAAPFIWTIDANPQDIDKVDFVLPDGTPQKMTIGDYRQLSDALFHAGTNSGSAFEYVDTANRLHFYILDRKRDRKGVLSYEVAVRSLDGAGPATRGVRAYPDTARADRTGWARCTIGVRNTGRAADVFRVTAPNASLPRTVIGVAAGKTSSAEVWLKDTRRTTVTLTSESNPAVKATTSCTSRK